MAVKGLPDSYRAFVVHFTQTGDTLTFSEFKMRLRSYESTEKYSDVNADEDSVMRTSGLTSRAQGRGARASPNGGDRPSVDAPTEPEQHEWDTLQRGQGAATM